MKQLTLGELIAEMEKHGTENKTVRYDFTTATPTELHSYRGYYNQLALGYNFEDEPDMQAQDLLDHLKQAVGKTYTGWKGGEYKMSNDTPLWVDDPGDCSGTAIVGVINESHRLVILTEYIPW